jgi:hypothetical protein
MKEFMNNSYELDLAQVRNSFRTPQRTTPVKIGIYLVVPSSRGNA